MGVSMGVGMSAALTGRDGDTYPNGSLPGSPRAVLGRSGGACCHALTRSNSAAIAARAARTDNNAATAQKTVQRAGAQHAAQTGIIIGVALGNNGSGG